MCSRRLFLALLCGPVAFAQTLTGIDAFIEHTMTEMRVPGAAVGVMVDGRVVLAKGYGIRRAGGDAPVTPDTTFATGSITKSFTALALATLVDEKKLEWDRPVREYLPWFRLYDPVATALINTRDLLTHRSGMPRYDSMRFLVHFTRPELIRRLQYLPPSKTFRDGYQYNNLMYVTAGYLGGVLAGTTWEDLIRQRIFAPLGMKASTVDVLDMQKGADFASPHELRDGVPRVVPFYNYQRFGVGPNGAVNSNVTDLLRYLRFYLDGGVVAGKRLVSPESMAELWKPVTVVGDRATYALGWQIGWLDQDKIVSHSGSITGFSAYAILAPEKKIAIVVLNNRISPLPDLVSHEILHRLLNRPGIERRPRRPEPAPAPLITESPARDLSVYAGEYTHPAFGAIQVRRMGNRLQAVFPDATGPMRHRKGDEFEFEGEAAIFRMNADGHVAAVDLKLDPVAPPLTFTRMAAR